MARSVCGRGSMRGRGHVWFGDMHGRGHMWACMAGGYAWWETGGGRWPGPSGVKDTLRHLDDHLFSGNRPVLRKTVSFLSRFLYLNKT